MNALNPDQTALPDNLRPQYLTDVRAKQLAGSSQYTLALLFISLLFLIADYRYLHEEFEIAAFIRVSTITVLSALVLALRWLSIHYAFALLSAGMLFYNGVIVYFGVMAAQYSQYTYQQGTVLLILYCCTIFQAPVLYTAFISLGCSLIYVVGIALFSTTPLEIILNNALIFFTASVLGVFSVMQRERYLVQHFMDSLKLKQQSEVAQKQAFTDALTGLPNRYSILHELESYRGRVPKYLTVLMVDVDNFKKLNDQYGHQLGDLALQKVAQALKTHVKADKGYIARYGGEEFLIFHEDISFDHSQKIAAHLLQSISSIQYESLPAMTVSIGGVHMEGKDITSIAECIQAADRALLTAKSQGKNRFIFASD